MNRTGSAPLVVGVTGHRVVPDAEPILAGLSTVAERLERSFPDRPITILSSLAEGSDRVVAGFFMERGARLIAPLPLSPDEFINDFDAFESRRDFERLLARASQQVVMPPASSRGDAYLSAGLYILDHCNVLVAVWDGRLSQGRAGTAAIVAIARERGIPLAWVACNRRDGASVGPEPGQVTFERL